MNIKLKFTFQREPSEPCSERFAKPIDENELKVLILEGIVPSAEKMIEYIKHY